MNAPLDSPAFHFVFCPVLQEDISYDDCFTFMLCAEGLGPASVTDRLTDDFPDFVERCMNCRYHSK